MTEIRSGMNQERDQKGQFRAGTSGNPAGRPPGIPDKRTAVKRALLEPLLEPLLGLCGSINMRMCRLLGPVQ